MPPEKPETQLFVSFDLKKLSTYFYLFIIESNTAAQEDEQQDSIDEEIEAEIRVFFLQRI